MKIENPIVAAGLLLGAFAVGAVGLVATTHAVTHERIAENELSSLRNSLTELVPSTAIDNDIAADLMTIKAPEQLGAEETTIYRGRKAGAPVAAIFTTTVPDGYSGPIKLLVAVKADGSLAGVRVISHKETPGLGDKIEMAKSDWVLSFNGRSLGNPVEEQWRVKKDGGIFDQFTGATITPRSIVKAVKNTLLYYREHGNQVFVPAGPATAGN